jgi:hypothetical protein
VRGQSGLGVQGRIHWGLGSLKMRKVGHDGHEPLDAALHRPIGHDRRGLYQGAAGAHEIGRFVDHYRRARQHDHRWFLASVSSDALANKSPVKPPHVKGGGVVLDLRLSAGPRPSKHSPCSSSDEIAQLMTDPGPSDPWISNANRPFVAAPHQNAAR